MKILILENDDELYEGHPFTHWVERQKEAGHEVRMVTNAYNNGEEIIKQIEWPDRVAFTSTFIYIHAIYELSLAIAKHRSRLLEMWIMNDTLPKEIECLVEIHADTPRFLGYHTDKKTGDEVPDYEWYMDEDKAEQYGYALRNVVISQFDYIVHAQKETVRLMHRLHHLGLKWQMKLDEDKDFLLSRQQPEALTGRMVRIKPGILQSAPGGQWANLKPGMIVPELSMMGASERVQGKMQDRGVWVMGVGEPVKILNDDPGGGSRKYDEFEYVIRCTDDLVVEILKMCDKPTESKYYHFVLGVLKDDSPEMTPHWKATAILDEFDVRRRNNRSILEERIQDLEKLSNKTSTVKE